MNHAEFNPMDPALEQAMNEIRGDSADHELIEAAAARVWARLAEATVNKPAEHIRTCADFQALIPEFRAHRLSDARATLLQDHLHECVACRKVYEGRVVTMPLPAQAAPAARRTNYSVRWAAAAAVVAAAGISIWFAYDQFGTHTGRALVQSVNGTLYEVSAAGIRPIATGQDLPDGVEVRTAKDSTAMLQLRDGSVVEVRERSGLSTTQSAADLTVHLDRGSIIVQAAHRRKGHLYVATADCQVAVTGTVFSVSAGVKGSRVSVVQGEVRVSQNNTEKVLRPGDQAVTSPVMEPLSVRDDIGWSRNRDKLLQQLASLRAGIQQIHMPALRYESRLLARLPATTTMFASIPNLSAYLGEAQSVFDQQLATSPELKRLWDSKGARVEPIIGKMRAAGEYLGDEVIVAGFTAPSGETLGPVFLAETRKSGFPEFLTKEMPGTDLTIETRGNLVVFGPMPAAVKALAATLDTPSGGFQGTPFYTKIADSYRQGVGLLIAGDLSRSSAGQTGKVRFFMAEQKEVNSEMETRASVGFEGQRTGMAAWLANPSPMGSLDYVSPDATFVTAFVVSNPVAIVDELLGTYRRSPEAAEQALSAAKEQTGIDVRNDLAASLGGEFSLSLDGAPFPVPSWKLVTEVYDPSRVQATLQKVVDSYNQAATRKGERPLRTAQENADGRTYYMIAAADPNPLTEAHYTFADGYLIAGPTRALVSRALQVKATRANITHSTQFLAMEPRDHYNNYSALIYQNLGTSLAPLTSLLGAFVPARPGQPNPLNQLSNMKPMMLAVYGEPDRLTVAGSSNVLGTGLADFMGGNLAGVVGKSLPFGQMLGTRVPQNAYR